MAHITKQAIANCAYCCFAENKKARRSGKEGDILPGFLNFTLADIISILLSAGSIIAALSIPKAIMKFKIENDLKSNIPETHKQISRLEYRLQNEEMSVGQFIFAFNNIRTMVLTYSEYMGSSIHRRVLKLDKRYNKLTEMQSDSPIDKVKAHILLCDYDQFIATVNLQIGGTPNNDDDEQQ